MRENNVIEVADFSADGDNNNFAAAGGVAGGAQYHRGSIQKNAADSGQPEAIINADSSEDDGFIL